MPMAVIGQFVTPGSTAVQCIIDFSLFGPDISNQRIVTLTYNLSRSSKVKPMGSLCIISVGSNIVTVAVFDIFHVKKYDLDF